MSLSRYRISCISGSSIVSTRMPHTTPAICFRFGFSCGALRKKSRMSACLPQPFRFLLRYIGQPGDHLEHFVHCASFFIRLADQKRIDFVETYAINFSWFIPFSPILLAISGNIFPSTEDKLLAMPQILLRKRLFSFPLKPVSR